MSIGELGGWLFLICVAGAACYYVREGYLNWTADGRYHD